MKLNDIPKKYKVLKPWGYEYCIYRNSISSTKLLHLKHKKKPLYTVTQQKKQDLYY